MRKGGDLGEAENLGRPEDTPFEKDTWLRSRHRPEKVVTVSYDDNWWS
jgi:hypothetical protein